MNGIRDTATVTLNVNGAQAKQMMADIEAKIKQTEETIDNLKKSMADPKDVEKAKKQLKDYRKQLGEMQSATEGVNRALENIELATPRELEKALRTLNKQLKDMVPGSDIWDSHQSKIQELKERLSELRGEVESQQSAWESFKTWAGKAWPALDLLEKGYDIFIPVMREYVDAYAGMEQEMANVRKFTGMTEEEVASLNEEFKKIDTRTPREELNKLAQEAGRLGKTSEEDVLGFVRAADKINVALDDLGDGATLTLSKLTSIFGDEKIYGTEQSLLKVGSVINELSQNCSASAPYIAHFAERMGGVGAQAGLTIPQIMGFGAVLDSNAQALEASSTALSQIIVRLYQDPAKYAKVAGLDAQEFASLMREDANAALILFLETLQKAGGMDKLSPMFKDMGENGSQAIAALSTLATHIDQVKSQQEAANDAFREGTSIDTEFAVQNETVQASLDKCKNQANELRVELGEHLYPLMGHFLTTSVAVMRIVLTLVRWTAEHKGVVIALASAIAAYTITVNLAIIKEKTLIAVHSVARASMLLWTASVRLGAAALALFTGNLRRAHVAWRAFSMALHASPVGLAVASITALVVILGALVFQTAKATTETERLAKVKRKIAEAEKQAEASCAVELKTLEALYTATQNQNLAMDARLKAVAKLQETYPDYFKDLSQEEILAGKAADTYERLRKNIIRSAQARARKDLLAETEEEILKVQRDRDRKVSDALADVRVPEIEKLTTPRYEGEYGLERGYVETNPSLYHTKFYIHEVESDAAEKLALLKKEREALGTAVANDTIEELENDPENDPPGGNPNKDRFAEEKAWRERAEAEARIAYATGEHSYSEHTRKMDEIAVDYYKKILEREDVVGDELLSLTAQYYEAVNKKTANGNKLLVDEENSSYQQTLYNLNESYRLRLAREDLSAEERENAERAHQEAMELAELNHLARLVELYDEGSAERLQAQQKYQAAEMAAQKRHQQEYERKEAEYAKYKEKFFGDNPEQKKQKYDAAFKVLKEVYNREITAAGDNAAERLRIEEAFLRAQAALRQEYGQQNEEATENSYIKAVSEFNTWLQSDGGKALNGSLQFVTQNIGATFSALSSLIQAETQLQTAQIEKRYDKESQLAQGNSYKIAKLEKRKEADIAKAKREANKKLFAMQVIQAVAQSALAGLNAYSSTMAIPIVGPILAPAAMALALATGAIQIAAVKKQQQASEAQGFSQGGFTRPGGVNEPAGIVHAGEWVASQKLLANPVARPMIETLDYVQRTNTIGSLRADDVSRSITANNSLVRIAESDNGSLVMAAVASRMSDAVSDLTDRLNEPFVTVNTEGGDYGMKQARDKHARLLNNKSPKSRRNGTNN